MESETSRIGLYDARFEHDACGVAFVADCDADRRTSWSTWRSRRWRISRTAAPSARTPRPAMVLGSFFRCPTASFGL